MKSFTGLAFDQHVDIRIGELTQRIQTAAGISDALRDELFLQALAV